MGKTAGQKSGATVPLKDQVRQCELEVALLI
jgi:hypothetical protein